MEILLGADVTNCEQELAGRQERGAVAETGGGGTDSHMHHVHRLVTHLQMLLDLLQGELGDRNDAVRAVDLGLQTVQPLSRLVRSLAFVQEVQVQDVQDDRHVGRRRPVL